MSRMKELSLEDENNEEKQVFKIIKTMCGEYKTKKEIADELNKRNFLTYRGKPFTENAVHFIIYRKLKLKKQIIRNHVVEEIKDYIKKNYPNPNISIQSIVDYLNLNGFKNKYNESWNKPNVYNLAYELKLKRNVIDRIQEKENLNNEIENDYIPSDDNLVFEKDGKVFTNSRYIAKTFEKRHDSILRDIRELIEKDKDLGLHNFEESSYINSQNKEQPMYLISRDGFTFLVMGFTGDKAFQFKKAYIKRFNEMEAIINKRTLPPPKQENPFNPNMSALDIMKLTIQAFEEQKTEMIGLIQNQVSSVKEELKSEIKNEVQELKSEIELKEQAKKEQELKEKEDLLKSMQEVEYSDRLPLEIPVRKKIKKVIDIYVDFKKIDYPEVWNILDREVYNRLGFDIKTRKDNYRAKGIKKTRLDIYEDLGILEPVFDIASFIFRIDKDVA